jgi:hypothetical protein
MKSLFDKGIKICFSHDFSTVCPSLSGKYFQFSCLLCPKILNWYKTNIFETLKTEMFLALTFLLILISAEIFPIHVTFAVFFTQILAVWIWTINLNKYSLLWHINVFDYCHYGCPGVLDSQNLGNSYVCMKGAFGIRQEKLRNSLNVYPAEKRKKSSNVYLFRNPAPNIKQVSSKRNWKGLSKHGTPKYMCYIHENLTVAQLSWHTAVHQRGPSIRSPSTTRSRPLFLVAFNIYLPPQCAN